MPNIITPQHLKQAVYMIGMRMGKHYQLDSPVHKRHLAGKLTH